MGSALLAFLTVSLSILAGYQLVSIYLSRNSERVRERLVDEFGRSPDGAAASPLYESLDQLSLESLALPGQDARRRPRRSRI